MSYNTFKTYIHIQISQRLLKGVPRIRPGSKSKSCSWQFSSSDKPCPGKLLHKLELIFLHFRSSKKLILWKGFGSSPCPTADATLNSWRSAKLYKASVAKHHYNCHTRHVFRELLAFPLPSSSVSEQRKESYLDVLPHVREHDQGSSPLLQPWLPVPSAFLSMKSLA